MRPMAPAARSLLALLTIGALAWLAVTAGADRRMLPRTVDSLATTLNDALDRLARDRGWVIRELVLVGAEGPARSVIEKALAGVRGQPTVAVSPQAVLERLLAEPWVRDARIERQWPDRLMITVTVRRPAAVRLDGAAETLIAADGTPLGPVPDGFAVDGLLRITGAGAAEALADLLVWRARYPELFAQLDHAVRVGRRRWDLVLVTGLRILLPERGEEYGPEQALARLVALDRQDRILARALTRIDLRLADRIFLAPAPAADPAKRRRRS